MIAKLLLIVNLQRIHRKSAFASSMMSNPFVVAVARTSCDVRVNDRTKPSPVGLPETNPGDTSLTVTTDLSSDPLLPDMPGAVVSVGVRWLVSLFNYSTPMTFPPRDFTAAMISRNDDAIRHTCDLLLVNV